MKEVSLTRRLLRACSVSLSPRPIRSRLAGAFGAQPSARGVACQPPGGLHAGGVSPDTRRVAQEGPGLRRHKAAAAETLWRPRAA